MLWVKKALEICFCLLFILVPLIFLPNTSELFEFNKILITYLLASVIIGLWLTRTVFEKRFVFRHTPMDIPLIIYLVINFVSLLFSLDPHTSFIGYYSRWNGGFLSLFVYSLLYWAFVSNLDSKAASKVISWSVFATIPICLWGVAEHFGVDASWWVQDVQNRVFSTLGQPNWLAAYLVALIFIPLSWVLSASSKKSLWLYSLLSLLIFLTLLFTKSRSGLLAFAIASVVFWLPQLKKYFVHFAVFSVVSLLLTFTIPNPLRDYLIKSAPSASVSGPALEVGGTESGSIRKIVWTGAVDIWRSSPKNLLVGSGPETFAQAYYQFRPIAHNATSEWELLYNKAHNEFLNVLATTGLLGLLSYLFLLGTIGWILFKSANLPLLAGWLTLSVTNFWGFSVVITQLFLFLFPAFAVSLSSPPVSPKLQSSGLSNGQILCLLVIIPISFLPIFLIGKYWLADTHLATGQRFLRLIQQTTPVPEYLITAYQHLETAIKINPSEPAILTDFSLSAAYLSSALAQNDATMASQLANISLSAADKAIMISPHHPNYYKSAARSLLILASQNPAYYEKAITVLQAAAQISPTDPRLPYNIGTIYKFLNQPASASAFFKQAVQLKPDFVDAKVQLQTKP